MKERKKKIISFRGPAHTLSQEIYFASLEWIQESSHSLMWIKYSYGLSIRSVQVWSGCKHICPSNSKVSFLSLEQYSSLCKWLPQWSIIRRKGEADTCCALCSYSQFTYSFISPGQQKRWENRRWAFICFTCLFVHVWQLLSVLYVSRENLLSWKMFIKRLPYVSHRGMCQWITPYPWSHQEDAFLRFPTVWNVTTWLSGRALRSFMTVFEVKSHIPKAALANGLNGKSIKVSHRKCRIL